MFIRFTNQIYNLTKLLGVLVMLTEVWNLLGLISRYLLTQSLTNNIFYTSLI